MTTSTTGQLSVHVLHGLAGPHRDRELVQFVGRHGIVSIEHVMAALGVGRTAAYRRVASLIEAGLLERLELLRCEPSLISATTAGLDYVGLPLTRSGSPSAKSTTCCAAPRPRFTWPSATGTTGSAPSAKSPSSSESQNA